MNRDRQVEELTAGTLALPSDILWSSDEGLSLLLLTTVTGIFRMSDASATACNVRCPVAISTQRHVADLTLSACDSLIGGSGAAVTLGKGQEHRKAGFKAKVQQGLGLVPHLSPASAKHKSAWANNSSTMAAVQIKRPPPKGSPERGWCKCHGRFPEEYQRRRGRDRSWGVVFGGRD